MFYLKSKGNYKLIPSEPTSPAPASTSSQFITNVNPSTTFSNQNDLTTNNNNENINDITILNQIPKYKTKKMLKHEQQNHINTSNNINMDPPDISLTNQQQQKSIFPESKSKISLKILLFLIMIIIILLSFSIIILTYQYIECKNNIENNENTELIENIFKIEKSKLTKNNKNINNNNCRLPKALKPINYTINIIPFIYENNFTFHGEVRIVFNVTLKSSNVTLHANDLHIKDFTIKRLVRYTNNGFYDGEKSIYISEIKNDTYNQFLIFDLGEELDINYQYELYIKYIGHLNNDMHGLYRSSYKIKNETRWLMASQFQPTDARRAFPCFDEPALKAKFKISIARWKNMSSISNMQKIEQGLKDSNLPPDYVWDHYKVSIPMSTYLVAMIVSDFREKQDTNSTFSVWARSEALQQAEYSLKIGPKILKYFATHFNVKYPLLKTDMIALPDFNAGAMENFGLITFRENSMLYDQHLSTNFHKERVATVVSHELAHQWFGNLVTLSWWNDLWLNEGFASYIEYFGVDAVEPDWRILELFVVEELQTVFSLDALKSSHPVQIEVSRPDEISEIFDRISYGKGASILRMTDHFLTSTVMKNGLTVYITSNYYKTTTQNDLWTHLTKAAHDGKVLPPEVDVATIMNTWTTQTGFPYIKVVRNYETGSASLTQERFLLEATEMDISEKPLWWVPITFTTSSKPNFTNTKPSHWMKAKRNLLIKKDEINAFPNDWIIFNLQETGFYRVLYDHKNWELIIATLRNQNEFETIHVLNRAQLIDDSMNLARAGLLNYETALNVTTYLQHETALVPWRSAMMALGYIEGQLYRKGGFDKFKKFMLHLLDKLYNDVGFTQNEDDDQLTIYKRIDVLNRACALGHTTCINNAMDKFSEWRTSPSTDFPLSPNLKSVITCTGIRWGSSDDWDFVWEKYKNSNLASEKDTFISSLACSSEYWVLARYLDLAITENSPIRKQDAARVFGAVAQNAIGHSVAFTFLLDNWERIQKYFAGTHFHITSIVKFCTKRISTYSELKQLTIFAKENRKDLLHSSRTIVQVVENAQANVDWIKKNYETIDSWLSNAKNYDLS